MTWRDEIRAVITARIGVPFRWGAQDCCLFAADCARLKSGIDHAADVRGAYSNRRTATAALRRVGGLEGAAKRAGPEIPSATAEDGDIGLVFDGRRDVLAVCFAQHWYAPAANGLAIASFGAARRAWRVECRK